jgi:AcrR family transcriptional regulator
MKKRTYDMTKRSAKAEATKQRILDGAIPLYRERQIEEFTLDDVAERAGTTVQTILRIFGSKEELVYEMLAKLSAVGSDVRETPPGDVAAAVRAIFEVYESIGDLVVRRLSDASRRPQLRPMLDEARQYHRAWVTRTFAPLFEGERGAARAQLFHAVVAATDVATWNVLRRDCSLPRAAAEAVVRRLIDGLTSKEEHHHGSYSVAQLVGRR